MQKAEAEPILYEWPGAVRVQSLPYALPGDGTPKMDTHADDYWTQYRDVLLSPRHEVFFRDTKSFLNERALKSRRQLLPGRFA
jgi:hypothetical protein